LLYSVSMAAHLIQLPRKANNGRVNLWTRSGGKCHWCGILTTLQDNRWNTATRDHVLPRYKGGTGDRYNIVLACFRCNNRRSHEDARGLPEGALLGKYKPNCTGVVSKNVMNNRVCLTADEKKAIINGKVTPVAPPMVVTVQDLETVKSARDYALKELANTRFKLESHRLALEEVKAELHVWQSITVWRLIRLRIAEWIVPKIK
jgi:hypothetical protein